MKPEPEDVLPADAPERAASEAQIAAALPALRALGVFDLFEPRDARLRTLIVARRPGPVQARSR